MVHEVANETIYLALENALYAAKTLIKFRQVYSSKYFQ
jgi:hypothetical protein